MASGLFRAIAALGRNMIVANTFGSFAVLTLLALGGFILSRKDIKSWWIWGSIFFTIMGHCTSRRCLTSCTRLIGNQSHQVSLVTSLN